MLPEAILPRPSSIELPTAFSTPKNITENCERYVRHGLNSRNQRRRNTTAISIIATSLRIHPLSTWDELPLESETEHMMPTDSSGRRRSNKLTCCTSWSGRREGFPVRWRCSSIERRWRWRRRRCRPFGWHPPGRHAQESRAWWRNVSAIYATMVERGAKWKGVGVFEHERGKERGIGEIPIPARAMMAMMDHGWPYSMP